ncbi:hypothetical protein ACFOZ5_12505 [Marinobacter lacisalsi]|uniref:Uncharacterized protein n=1 Tax=Marinobacter lacisalsi TaxID=475979 RepID=A0ABV8QJH1_9GAMM
MFDILPMPVGKADDMAEALGAFANKVKKLDPSEFFDEVFSMPVGNIGRPNISNGVPVDNVSIGVDSGHQLAGSVTPWRNR